MLQFVRDSSTPDPLVDGFAEAMERAGMPLRPLVITRKASDAQNIGDLLAQIDARKPLAGFSYGARIALASCASLAPARLVCIGFPFHPRSHPEQSDRLRAFDHAPRSLIIQGDRDVHGNRPWLAGKTLPPQVEFRWIVDANHRLEPRKPSTSSFDENLTQAVSAVLRFLDR